MSKFSRADVSTDCNEPSDTERATESRDDHAAHGID